MPPRSTRKTQAAQTPYVYAPPAPGTTSIVDLPDDVLVEIFSKLPFGRDRGRLASTCKKMHAISRNESLFVKLPLVRFRDSIKDDVFKRLVSPHTIELDLTSVNIEDATVAALLPMMNKLHRLVFGRRLRSTGEKPIERMLTAPTISLIQNLTQLETLSLYNCRQTTDDALLSIVTSAPHITDLNLRNCKKLTASGVVNVTRLPNLVKLNLWGIVVLTDAALISIAKGAPQIQELSLRFCLEITNDGVSELIVSCPNLRVLDLGYCMSLKPCLLSFIAEKAGSLEVLMVDGIPAISDSEQRSFKTARPTVEIKTPDE